MNCSRRTGSLQPLQLASTDYKPDGYLIDFQVVTEGSPMTFITGETISRFYFIKDEIFSQPEIDGLIIRRRL